MNKFFSIFALFFATSISAQEIDLNTLPKFDCHYKKWSAFSKDTIIVVKPSTKSYETGDALDNFYQFINHRYIVKNENELSAKDFQKSLLIVGKASDFQRWNSFNIPIKKNKNGFIFNRKHFFGKQDALWLNDSKRIVITANDFKALSDIMNTAQLGMDAVVLQNSALTFFGNFKDKNQNMNWFNIQNLKKTNYNIYREDNADFYISKKFKDSLNLLQINQNLKSHVKKYADYFDLKIPKSKINILVHQNQPEIFNMIGMWNLGCGGNTAGMNVRGEIHTVGVNQGLMNHEISHHIFNSNIPAEKLPPLLVEGVVETFSNFENRAMYHARIKNVIGNWEKFDFKAFFENGNTFYNENSSLNYELSGLWVQYFIDSLGLEKFKSFCKSDDKIAYLEALAEQPFADFNQKFKMWLDVQEAKTN